MVRMSTGSPVLEGQPNPFRFKIMKAKQFGPMVLALINYPDCKNYEGSKVLLYQDLSIEELFKRAYLDPHFIEDECHRSPIARFEPTDFGWEIGEMLAKRLQ